MVGWKLIEGRKNMNSPGNTAVREYDLMSHNMTYDYRKENLNLLCG